MGWSNGSEIARTLWDIIEGDIVSARRKHIAKKIIALFEDYDCDTMDECLDLTAAAKGK